MTEFGRSRAALVLERWQDLADTLIAKYADGYINPGPHDRKSAIPIGYPSSWLSLTNYADGPTTYTMPVRRRG